MDSAAGPDFSGEVQATSKQGTQRPTLLCLGEGTGGPYAGVWKPSTELMDLGVLWPAIPLTTLKTTSVSSLLLQLSV